ncbi:hypothetical protein Egran_02485 [Elaphomyces granulatus]|uniref:DUF1308 domain-containing protein n=1 Tax=Elaphomyces granulatus TaxID=519963 RepID=A0A232M064_9EURO|nr:hypothetical protein Egran_02485 [Elaphomyces granulatus]
MSTTKATIKRKPFLSSTRLHQCRLLLAELDAFKAYFSTQLHKPQLVEIRQLRSSVVSELRVLEKLAEDAERQGVGGDEYGEEEEEVEVVEEEEEEEGRSEQDEGEDEDDGDEEERKKIGMRGEKRGGRCEKDGEEYDNDTGVPKTRSERRLLHALRSSNLPFYMAVWTTAKDNCKGVVAFGKRFYCDGIKKRDNETHDDNEKDEANAEGRKLPNGDRKKSVFVDIVADNGQEWVKVSTISESRLLFEMAEKGWDRGGDSLSEGEGEEEPPRKILHNSSSNKLEQNDDDDDDDEIELVKLAMDMMKAARATRVRYRHPRIRFVFPKLVEGKIPEIDDILDEIRGHGVTVECGTCVPDVIEGHTEQTRDPERITPQDLPLSTLLPNPFEQFGEILNVDCTLLLALVSDLSHIRNLVPSTSHHRAIRKQIELESQQPMLPTEIWPALVERHLVCTQEAAKRMREIVYSIGTDKEKQRTEILMGESPVQSMDRKTLLRRFQELSDYDVPPQWHIPIEVIDAQAEISAGWHNGTLPRPMAQTVAEILSDINRSVFLYGWTKGVVTVTSNRTVVKQIENTIENNRNGDDNVEGPQVWVCDIARSLVGKDKNRKP